MSDAPSTREAGPRAPTQAAIGAVLLALAVALWVDASRLPPPAVGGVGPAVAPRIVGVLLAVLGAAHLVTAWRQRALQVVPDRGNHRSLGWVLAALLGLIAVLQFEGGFVIGSTWLFIATARAFGEPIRARSVLIGGALSLAVYLFFTRLLSLTLPAGPLERLVLG